MVTITPTTYGARNPQILAKQLVKPMATPAKLGAKSMWLTYDLLYNLTILRKFNRLKRRVLESLNRWRRWCRWQWLSKRRSIVGRIRCKKWRLTNRLAEESLREPSTISRIIKREHGRNRYRSSWRFYASASYLELFSLWARRLPCWTRSKGSTSPSKAMPKANYSVGRRKESFNGQLIGGKLAQLTDFKLKWSTVFM